MVKPEWGMKRICPNCGTRYYDMRRDPVTCPKCSALFDPEALLKTRRARVQPVVEEEAAEEPLVGEEAEADVEAEELEGEGEEEALPIEGEEEEEEEEELIEDASELGEDEDDMAEVIENVEDDEER